MRNNGLVWVKQVGGGRIHQKLNDEMINVELLKQLCYQTLQMDLRGETENSPSLADRFLGSGESRVICRFDPEYSCQLKLTFSLCRWRSSLWKLIWKELLVYTGMFMVISMVYR